MRVRSYRGKRVTPSARPAGAEGAAQTMLRVAVFPFLFVYLELILHILLRGAPEVCPSLFRVWYFGRIADFRADFGL